MLDTLEQAILSALQVIFDQFGWLGVFGLMIFESATGITPAEVILAFAGWMLIERHEIPASFIPLAGLYAGLGSTLGSSITYWIARRGGRPLVERIVKFLHIQLPYLQKVEDQCRQWGAGVVLVGRFIPGVRVFVNVPAGIVRIPFPKFVLATFIGTYLWCTVLIGLGYVLGHEWVLISDYIKTHVPLILAAAVLIVCAYLVYRQHSTFLNPGWTRQENKETD